VTPARRPRRALALAAVLLGVATGVLVGCGGGGDAPPARSSAGAPSGDASSGTPERDLVSPVDAPAPPLPRLAKRAGVVDLQTSLLLDAAGDPQDAPGVHLKLFEKDYVTDLVHAGQGGVEQWTGTVQEVPKSTVVVVRAGSAFRLGVISPEGAYQVTPSPDGLYLLTETDPSLVPPENESPPVPTG
jgi:hypothetical protein